MQRGALGALSPIQEGASRVLKPFRDLFGWFGDTIDAKDQRDKAIAERDAYRAPARAAPRTGCARPSSGRGSTRCDTTRGMSKYGPVDARVYHRARPTAGTSASTINKGTDDGVHRGDPVINGAGLVGKVEEATGGDAVVTLITDQSFATGVIAGDGARAGQRHARRRRARRPAVRARRRRRHACARTTSSTRRARPTARLAVALPAPRS